MNRILNIKKIPQKTNMAFKGLRFDFRNPNIGLHREGKFFEQILTFFGTRITTLIFVKLFIQFFSKLNELQGY